MPWDHLNIWWQLRYDLLHAIDHAIAAAPLSGRFANVVLCNDGRLLLRICVAAGVIAVEVRIDDETDGLISDTFQCSLNLLGQPGVLIVDEDVVADGRSNVSRSLAFQHVNVAGHFRDVELNFAQILVLSADVLSADQAAGKPTGSKENPNLRVLFLSCILTLPTG